MNDKAFQIIQYDSVESTMTLAKKIAEEGDNHFHCIQAYEQKSGRGRHGNQWTSPKGNLYLSLILRPKKPLYEFGQMSFVVALALMDMLIASHVPKDLIKIKWPNDILVDDKKISGLLLEAGQDPKGANYLILGSGVNIFYAPDEKAKVSDHLSSQNKTNQIADQISVIDQCRDKLLHALDRRYQQWHDDNFRDIKNEWLQHAARLGEEITVRTSNERYNGIFETIDDHGALLLRQNSGITRKVQSGEVFF
jgi:BirA family biotin operon repressor/biotin-[acetyl-CoA-carboxylase] ligase